MAFIFPSLGFSVGGGTPRFKTRRIDFTKAVTWAETGIHGKWFRDGASGNHIQTPKKIVTFFSGFLLGDGGDEILVDEFGCYR